MIIREATIPEMIERDRLTAQEWGYPLSQIQFLERERRLRQHPWSQKSMRTWVLVNESGLILSSLETFDMPSILKKNAHIHHGITCGVASVYTAPEHRGRGHAKKLLSSVIQKDHESRSERLHSYILYSEVGEKIYRDVGFESLNSYERVFSFPSKFQRQSQAKLLTCNELAMEWNSPYLNQSVFQIMPDWNQLHWHIEREFIYAKLLQQDSLPYHGARIRNALIVWTKSFKDDLLRILSLQAESASEANELLHAAMNVASSHGIAKALAWEEDFFTQWDQLSMPQERHYREDSIAMIRPLARELQSEDCHIVPRCVWV